MKIKISEASGPVLDWLVAKCEGVQVEKIMDLSFWSSANWEMYSTDWAQGGPIIEREKMTVGMCIGETKWGADIYAGTGLDIKANRTGPTPLIAAMRCYVASKLGTEVEVPEELV